VIALELEFLPSHVQLLLIEAADTLHTDAVRKEAPRLESTCPAMLLVRWAPGCGYGKPWNTTLLTDGAMYVTGTPPQRAPSSKVPCQFARARARVTSTRSERRANGPYAHLQPILPTTSTLARYNWPPRSQ
jgi:hypothetical protein